MVRVSVGGGGGGGGRTGGAGGKKKSVTFSPAAGSASGGDAGSDPLGRGEEYYWRCVTELNQLRGQAASAIAPDVSQREVAKMLGTAENLFLSLLR